MFCTSATFTATASPRHFLCTSHMLSLAFPLHLPLPPLFPYAFLAVWCPFLHICCLDTGFECLQLLGLPFWRHRWKRLILYFPKSPQALPSDVLNLFIACWSESQSYMSTKVQGDRIVEEDLVPTLPPPYILPANLARVLNTR
jgi:hypothetical protein